MEYELLFFTTVANEERIGEIKKELTGILESLGGKSLGDFSDIGKRKLAYPIKRNTHAFFSFVRFELDDEGKQNIPEIGKRISLYDKVMRHMIVRADEIGKPVAAQNRPESAHTERRSAPIREARKVPAAAEPAEKAAGQPEAAEAKPKATLAELDEKINEILEETPK